MREGKSLILNVMMLAALIVPGCAADDGAQAPPDDDGSPLDQELTQSQQPYCVVAAVEAPQSGVSAPESVPPAVQCHDSFQSAIAAATGGRVQLPSSVTVDTVDDDTLNGSNAAANTPFVVGIEFKDEGFQGGSLIVTATKPCSNTFFPALTKMPQGWDNVISSAKAFSHCNHSLHFQFQNFTGKSHDCGAQCRFIGNAMNDRTSSISYTH